MALAVVLRDACVLEMPDGGSEAIGRCCGCCMLLCRSTDDGVETCGSPSATKVCGCMPCVFRPPPSA